MVTMGYFFQKEKTPLYESQHPLFFLGPKWWKLATTKNADHDHPTIGKPLCDVI
jgi:hypothetical protein